MSSRSALASRRAHRLQRVLGWAALVMLLVVLGVFLALNLRPSIQQYVVAGDAGPQNVAPRAVWLGVSTILIVDGETRILIDGYFSRPGLGSLLFGAIEPDARRIDAALARANIDRLDAIFVAHSHFDHALDVGILAKKTGAVVWGSPSTGNIAIGQGLNPSRIKLLTSSVPVSIGSVSVLPISVPHSPDPLFPGKVAAPLTFPAKASELREGGNFSFLVRLRDRSILIVPSANFKPGALRGQRADIVFLSIGALGNQSDAFRRTYWDETVRATGARLVVPIHWDDFTRPLDQPIVTMPYLADRVDRAMEDVFQRGRQDTVRVTLPQLYQPIAL